MGISDFEPLKEQILNGNGAGVRIGLLDTGVDSRHPLLAGRIAANYEAVMGHWGAVVNRVEHGSDSNEHGTACAGILRRLAPGAEIHSLQVVGDGPRDRPEKLIAGLRFAVERGWEVINVSVGITRPHPELHELVQRAWKEGTIIVAAKDNQPGVVGYPAAYPEVLSVDMDYFPDPLTWRYHPGRDTEADVEANGVYVDGPVAGCSGQARYTGSSFAAPHISAIAARLKEYFPEMEGMKFREVVRRLGKAANRGCHEPPPGATRQ